MNELENDFSKIDSNFTSRIVLGGLEQPNDENFFLKNTNKATRTKLTFLNRDWNFEVSDLLFEHPDTPLNQWPTKLSFNNKAEITNYKDPTNIS